MSSAALPQAKYGPGVDGLSDRLHGVLLEFDNVDALKSAARRVRDAGYTRWDTHSPFPVHGMDEAMGIRMTRLPWLVLACGVLGACVGLGMQWWMNSTNPLDFTFLPTWGQGYEYRVSGKPNFSLPANIPVTFEVTVLLASVACVVGMLAFNGLPRWSQPIFRQPRFRRVTSDRFFLFIDARDPRFEAARTTNFLRSLGGPEPEAVYEPVRTRRPAWMPLAALVIVALATLPPAVAYFSYVSKSPQRGLHLVQDMDNQWKYKAQQANPAFMDGRAMRPLVEGTVARGDAWELGTQAHLYAGLAGGEFATEFPPELELNVDFLRRGQERFNIYCAVCHGLDGSGNGIVAKRAREKTQIAAGFVPPTSLHDQVVLDRPVGHIFNTITNGIRTMPPYGDQIAPADRWAIIAYVRALERSQAAPVSDVPADRREDLR